MIITIDGPAGSGKSTVAKEVANKLNFEYIDSGALYRSLAFYISKKNILLKDYKTALKSLKINYSYQYNKLHITLNKQNITNKIRTEEISITTSKIAKNKIIRNFVTNLQRQIAGQHNVVLDGRDTGSVVFPNADYKFFLKASQKIRAKRRYLELKEKNLNPKLIEVYNLTKERDFNDLNRIISPLIKPKNAIIINTSNLTIKKVSYTILKTVRSNEKNKNSI